MTADHDFNEDPAAAAAGDPSPPWANPVAEPGLAATEPTDLLGELARVMHSAAESQHVRIAGELQRHRTAQVEAIKARASSASAELKATSEHDVAEIDAWAKTASELIVSERARRIDAQRELFEAELLRQEVMVERKVQAIEEAVEAHQAELDAFFGKLERESDPVGIAQLAASLPSFPSLTEAADAAMRQAAAEFVPFHAPAATPTADLDTGDQAAAEAQATAAAAQATAAEAQATAAAAQATAADAQASAAEAQASAAEAQAATPETPSIGGDSALVDGVEVSPERLMAATDPGGQGDDGSGIARPWPAPGAIAVHAGLNGGKAGSNQAHGAEAPSMPESKPLLRSIPSTRPMGLLRGWSRKPDPDPDREH